ncbi:hypothetical protein BCR44DRAFT_1496443 [Catenaria anguillulae PL171]|uniref:Uncharacterized protein n=1 Tax=Catenaria anguillulae PL171 TaxID=765915 RepID=A0A1Y2HY25_9FUNG|nr:hypothetical protein BCR44DRAFT_1496443 [Catenaria anguillulae PL171]
MLPKIKQSGQVLSPVEIHIPSDKPKPTTPLPGSVTNGQLGSLPGGSDASNYSVNPLASLGDAHNLDKDHINPEVGPPTPFQESLAKRPKNLAKQTPTIAYKKLSRDNAVAVLQKLNSREALQASRGLAASGLIDPATQPHQQPSCPNPIRATASTPSKS